MKRPRRLQFTFDELKSSREGAVTMPEIISSVVVWSSRLRWVHALLGTSVLLLLLTGELSQSEGSVAVAARDFHYLAAYAFVISFIFRVYLLFAGKKSEHVSDCLPRVNRSEVMTQHLRFYLSLGKSELTGWYAHNPFWGPIYLAVFVLSLFLMLTGFAIGQVYMGSGISLSGLHATAAGIMLVFVGLHLFAVILHDVKAENTGISAMLSGRRYFTREERPPAANREFPMTFTVNPSKKSDKS